MVDTTILAAVVGVLMPWLVYVAGQDSAAASNPIVTTTKDVSGLLIYFGLAMALVAQLNVSGSSEDRGPDVFSSHLTQISHMNYRYEQTLRNACERFGPGRLPGAHRPDIGAGYAASGAAFVATVGYTAVISILHMMNLGVHPTLNVVLGGIILPFVVIAAFMVGLLGWRLLPVRDPILGIPAGAIGAIATYGVTMLMLAVIVVGAAVVSLSGAEPLSAAAFAWGVTYFAFEFTWWVTIPVGCLAGYVYVSVVSAR